MDFCKCGSIIKNEKCSNNHCREKNEKCTSWVAGGRSMNFKKAITFEEASNIIEKTKKAEKKFMK